ncbi:MAG: hypothetical protein QW259_02915 [Pyrobaculum sp.]
MVYTIHKLATLNYVAQWAKRRILSIEVLEKAVLKIKHSHPHHRKKIHRVKVFLAVVKKTEEKLLDLSRASVYYIPRLA